MARRRKKAGGRVTPKGTRPRHWDSGLTLVPSVPPELEELLPGFDDELAVFRDAEASSFVSMFQQPRRSPFVVDLRHEDEDLPDARDVVAMLASFGPRPPQRIVDTIAAFAVYGTGDTVTEAAEALRSFATQPSGAASVFGQGTIESTLEIVDVFGEATQYLFELIYPDGSRGAIAVLIDRLHGGIVKDSVVMEDVAMFTDLADETDEITYGPADVGVAAAEIDAAYDLNDHTIVIDDLVDDDARALRPLVQRLLAPHKRLPVEPEPVPRHVRDRTVEAFATWASENHPETPTDIIDWSSLAVDFAADMGGHRQLGWGPNAVVGFLEWASRKVMAEPDQLREIPEMLRVFVPWAHAQAGWGDRYLDDSLAAIDRALPLFEQAIAADTSRGPVQDVLRDALAGIDLNDPEALAAAIQRYNEGLAPAQLTVPPAGGSHPEAFSDSALGADKERVGVIAELASVSARAIFDDEYVTLVRRLVADAALTEPALFERGRPDIWASGAVYAVAQLNDIIGGWGPMSMFADELTSQLAGAPGTITSKAATIRDALDESRWSLNPRYQHSGAHFDLGDLPFDGRPPTSLAAQYDRLPDGSSFVLRCQLSGLSVWRTVRVPAWITLHDLHQVMQRVFDWDDYHLHQFQIGGHSYTTDPDPDWSPDDVDDTQVRVDELVRPGAVVTYLYDFGDGWDVKVHVERLEEFDDGEPDLELVDGHGDAPPEDCGGVGGYLHLIDVLNDPLHPEYAELSEWAGDFRPGSFDLATSAARLQRGRS